MLNDLKWQLCTICARECIALQWRETLAERFRADKDSFFEGFVIRLSVRNIVIQIGVGIKSGPQTTADCLNCVDFCNCRLRKIFFKLRAALHQIGNHFYLIVCYGNLD